MGFWTLRHTLMEFKKKKKVESGAVLQRSQNNECASRQPAARSKRVTRVEHSQMTTPE